MSRLQMYKNSFTAGEISPRLLGRGDLSAYENGAAILRNVFIHPTGGLSRRSGLRFVDTARGTGRMVSFEFNTEQIYLLVFTDLFVDIYKNGVKTATITTPWTVAQIPQISWTQSADTLFVVHPDVAPKKITRTSDTLWSIGDITYYADDTSGRIFQPHHKFTDDSVSLSPSGTSGTITLTASVNVFVSGHQGVRMRVGNKEVEVTSVISATQVQATVKEALASTTATKDWEEQAFSAVRGWPVSVSFHQDRMVFGGSRDLPNRLWLSKSSDLFNHDLGTGLDDEAIEFAILSDQVNAVRAVFSGRHLQVFTTGSEIMVTGDPLTPGNIQLHRQTRIGSPVDRIVQPRDVDGVTLFVPRNGPELREFIFSDVAQAYQSNDLAMLAHHLLNDPVDQDYDQKNRLFHMVMKDGTIATVTIFRTEQVTAWTLQQTQGTFLSVAMAGNQAYVLVARNNGVFIEVFDDTMNVDSGLAGTDTIAKTVWSGLNHLEGETVKVLADGAVRGDKVVVGGAVSLDQPTLTIQTGLGFTHTVEPLPPSLQTPRGGTQGGRVRAIAITFRLQDTVALRLDTGRGFKDVPFNKFGANVLDVQPPSFSGDKKIRALGWRHGGTGPLWRIEHDAPSPFTLLSVTTEIGING